MSWSTQGFFEGVWSQDSGNTEPSYRIPDDWDGDWDNVEYDDSNCLDGNFEVPGVDVSADIHIVYGCSQHTYFRGYLLAESVEQAHNLLTPFEGLKVQATKYGGIAFFGKDELKFEQRGPYVIFYESDDEEEENISRACEIEGYLKVS